RRDADDVAGADGGGERGGERSEVAHVAFALGRARKGEPDRGAEVALDDAQADGQVEVRADEEDEERPAPQQVAERAEDLLGPLHQPPCANSAPSARTVASSCSPRTRGMAIRRSTPTRVAWATSAGVSGSKVVSEISSGGRPVVARSRRSSCTMGAAVSTVSPKPYQPSPKRAARRSAGGAWPPTTIGGCGRWRGFGSKRMPSKAAARGGGHVRGRDERGEEGRLGWRGHGVVADGHRRVLARPHRLGARLVGGDGDADGGRGIRARAEVEAEEAKAHAPL